MLILQKHNCLSCTLLARRSMFGSPGVRYEGDRISVHQL